MRKHILLGALLCITTTFAHPKNVLFIISDDLNNTIGALGHPRIQTPNLDRLAEDSFVFTRAYAQATVCNPSRASFLSGLSPNQMGIHGNRDKIRGNRPQTVAMPQFFRQHGYYTAASGKVFHADKYDKPSWSHTESWDFQEDPVTTGETRNVTDGKLHWMVWKAVESGKLKDENIKNMAIRQLAADRTEPFFLAVGFNRPHDPFFAPKKYFDLYPLETIPDPGVVPEQYPDESYGEARWLKHIRNVDAKGRREMLRAYYACVSFVDAKIGELLQELKNQGLEDDTVIVFLGDHGYHNWEKNWWGKTTVFENSARAPLMIKIPGHKGARVDRVVEFLDLFPTLAALCGLDTPEEVQGRSLLPLIEHPDLAEEKWIGLAFSQFRNDLWSVRTDRYRYCEWGETAPFECALYDMHNDPEEKTNLIEDCEYAGLTQILHKKIDEQRATDVAGEPL